MCTHTHTHTHTQTHTQNYYQTIENNEIMPFVTTWMDLEMIILSKSEKDKYHMISHMWNLKNDVNKLIYKPEIDS